MLTSRFLMVSHGAWPRYQAHALATKAEESSTGPAGVFIKKKEKKDKKGEGVSGLSPKMQRVLDMLMPPSQQSGPGGTPKRSAKDQEEYDRRCREFEEKKALEQETWRAASMEKIKLAKAALDALPPDLRSKAAVPDMSLFPLNREYLFHTPPTSYGQEAAKSAESSQQIKDGKVKSKKSPSRPNE